MVYVEMISMKTERINAECPAPGCQSTGWNAVRSLAYAALVGAIVCGIASAAPLISPANGAAALPAGATVPPQFAQLAAMIAAEKLREIRLEHSPAVKILNPYYIRIATAVIKNDDTALAKYAGKMQQFAGDKSKPYLWFPATRARTFCLARLKSESAFAESFATLCQAHGNLLHRDRLVSFSNYVFNYLAKHRRAAWVNAAVARALPQAGPPAGKLYMMLLNRRLAQLPDAKQRYTLIHNAIGQAKVWNLKQRAKAHGPLVFSSGLRSLWFAAVRNDAVGSDIPHLQADATEYLTRYRATGKDSPLVFLISQQAYIHAWLLSPKPAQKARIINAGSWMANWYRKIIPNAGQLAPQISHEFQQWQHLEQLAPAAR